MNVEYSRYANGTGQAIVHCDICGSTLVMAAGKNQEGRIRKRAIQNGWKVSGSHLHCKSCAASLRNGVVPRNVALLTAAPETPPAKETAMTTPRRPKNLSVVSPSPFDALSSIEIKAATPSETPPREPTRDQRRAIRSLLDSVYDDARGCYSAGETDSTVADAVGFGVMPGWVAHIREEFYGPEGCNDDMGDLDERLFSALATIDAVTLDAKALISEVAMLRDQIATLLGRLDGSREVITVLQRDMAAIRRAVGPHVIKAAGLK